MKLINICAAIILTGCTYSVNLLNTEGSATDMIDEQQTPTSEMDITVPLACCEDGQCGDEEAV